MALDIIDIGLLKINVLDNIFTLSRRSLGIGIYDIC